jgi:hypothetical protein
MGPPKAEPSRRSIPARTPAPQPARPDRRSQDQDVTVHPEVRARVWPPRSWLALPQSLWCANSRSVSGGCNRASTRVARAAGAPITHVASTPRIVFALECAADDLVAVDASGVVAVNVQAAAPQVFDYSRSARIPNVHNSLASLSDSWRIFTEAGLRPRASSSQRVSPGNRPAASMRWRRVRRSS